MRDLIIIGAGPAGITAGVYAGRKKLDVLVISRDVGGQAAWGGDIENYTGYQFITGPELAQKFEEHMRKYNIALRENEKVILVKRSGEIIEVRTDKAGYSARAVIVASGKRTKELDVPGETEFRNKGLSYCATCDGPLFSGKDVAVIGSGNSALDAALQLARIARHTYIINSAEGLAGDPVMRDKLTANPAVSVINKTRVKAVSGGKTVNAVEIEKDGKIESIAVRGVFVEIGLIPNSEICPGVKKNESFEIMVNCRNETDIPGIFAAGDVTDVPEKQIIIAAGEGAKACLSAFHYISRMPDQLKA